MNSRLPQDADLDPLAQFVVHAEDSPLGQPPVGDHQAAVANVALEAMESDSIRFRAQLLIQQCLDQGLGHPIEHHLDPGDAVSFHGFHSAQMEGATLADLESSGTPFVHADAVQWAESQDRLTREDLRGHPQGALRVAADDLAPEQAMLAGFVAPDQLADPGRFQTTFEKIAEPRPSEHRRQVDAPLVDNAVHPDVGDRLQTQILAKVDLYLPPVPAGEQGGKGGLDLHQHLGPGQAVPAGEQREDGLHAGFPLRRLGIRPDSSVSSLFSGGRTSVGGWSERNVLYTKARTIRPEKTPRALSVISLTAAKVVKPIGSDVRKFCEQGIKGNF